MEEYPMTTLSTQGQALVSGTWHATNPEAFFREPPLNALRRDGAA